MDDLISRQTAIDAAIEELDGGTPYDIPNKIMALPSAEPKIYDDGTLEINVSDIQKITRVLVVDAHWGGFYYPDEEPKTEAVFCALADRTCPFQGKEFAWCLTCSHISEEDRDLVKKAIEPETGHWISFDSPWYQCSECGAVRENKTFMENFCPNCGAKMLGEDGEV